MYKTHMKQLTKDVSKLKITPYHKIKCKCPFCNKCVIKHKLRRHQRSAKCQLAQLQRQLHGF